MACNDLTTVIKDALRDQNMKDVSIEYSSAGGGYIATVITAVVYHSQGTINLFIKKHETESAKAVSNFEIAFYKAVVPKLYAASRNTWNEVPKCYSISENEIVLENLRADNFSIWNNLQSTLEIDYVAAVLKSYGRFHALSYALKQSEPQTFAKISNSDFEAIKFVKERYINQSIIEKHARRATKSFAKDDICAEAFRKFINEDLDAFVDDFLKNDKYNVVVHGDCWTNNFMFRKGEKGIDVRLLDFQLSRKASPIVDLSYFLTTSGCSEEVFNNIEQYLKIYHSSLVKQLEYLSCKSDVLPFCELEKLWFKYGKYGLFWSMSVTKMMIADPDEMTAALTDRGLLYCFYFLSRNEEIYDERMRLIIRHFFG